MIASTPSNPAGRQRARCLPAVWGQALLVTVLALFTAPGCGSSDSTAAETGAVQAGGSGGSQPAGGSSSGRGGNGGSGRAGAAGMGGHATGGSPAGAGGVAGTGGQGGAGASGKGGGSSGQGGAPVAGAGGVGGGEGGTAGAAGGVGGSSGASGAGAGGCSNVKPEWPTGAALVATPALDQASLKWPAAQSTNPVSSYEILVDSESAASLSPTSLSFLAGFLVPGTSHAFAVVAHDDCGGASDPLTASAATPPLFDPAASAPPLAVNGLTPFFDANRFLVESPTTAQFSVQPGTIVGFRAAVVRGLVRTCSGAPDPGVRVSVPGQPDVGHTYSRTDGTFDLLINGGGEVAVRFERSGSAPVDRKATVPWNEYVRLPDVVLTPYAPTVTSVTLPVGGSFAIARGPVETDASGVRRATLLLPPGLTASMRLPDGTSAPLTEMHVRATEYTVGACGPTAMPATLPRESGYTYALELSVDEAIKANATTVEFSTSAPFYVENFLNFPTGSPVPIGAYDRDTSCWVPETPGRVLAVLDITAGMASLDLDGDGKEDDATKLAAAGITDAERAALAGLYTKGTTLWRAALPHLSPHDCNWPYGPYPPNAPFLPDELALELDPDCDETGSRIGCLDQSLAEDFPLAGTGTSLSYSTRRTPVRAHAQINVPVTGATVDPMILNARVVVDVAGTHWEKTFPSSPNLNATFAWDGTDAYGRNAIGAQKATVKLGYEYKVDYEVTDGSFASAGYDGKFDAARQTVFVEVVRELTLTARSPTPSDGWSGWELADRHQYDPISHTVYFGNGHRRVLESGGKKQELVVETVAGSGQSGSDGDGGLATAAKLCRPVALGFAPDGTMYIADTCAFKIRRVFTDGTIDTFAGTGTKGCSGDGGPATSAELNGPAGLAVDCHGNVFIADDGGQSIRRIDTNGIITTVAGYACKPPTGMGTGVGGPAVDANIAIATAGAVLHGSELIADKECRIYFANQPGQILRIDPDGILRAHAGTTDSTFPAPPPDGDSVWKDQIDASWGIAFSATGDLLVGAPSSLSGSIGGSILRLGADGVVRRVAGSTAPMPPGLGDGGPALAASFGSQVGLTGTRDGSILFIDELPGGGDRVVRRISPAGTIDRLAGGGTSTSTKWTAASDLALVDPSDLEVSPSGAVYLADGGNARVLRLGFPGPDRPMSTQTATPPVPPHVPAGNPPGPSTGELAVPEEDGAVVDVFDAISGRHLRSFDALSGAIRRVFSYDASGALVSFADGFGNATTVERDPKGRIVTLTNPYGKVSSFSYDASSNLASITNPANESWSMTYEGSTGLLSSLTSPNGKTHNFTYDASHGISKDADPTGGFKQTAVTTTAASVDVAITTALGRKSTYSAGLSGGADDGSRVVARPDGRKVTTSPFSNTGSTTALFPDGTSETVVEVSDPRFGVVTPAVALWHLDVAGKTLETSSVRSYELADKADPYSLLSFTETLTSGNSSWTSHFDSATSTLKATMPSGRSAETKLNTQGQVASVHRGDEADALYDYDSHGRLASVSQGSRQTTFAYDSAGNLTTVTDPLGRIVTRHTDAVGRLLSVDLPDGRHISLARDKDGNTTSLTPPGGSAHLLGYDAIDELASWTSPQVGSIGDTQTWARDTDHALVAVKREDGISTTLGYNTAGQVAALNLPSGQGSITYAYDAKSADLVTATGPMGVSYSPTFSGPTITGMSWSGDVVGKASFTYDAHLRLQYETVASILAIYGYDADSFVTSVNSLSLARDPQSGRVVGSTLGSVKESWTYDSLYGELAAHGVNVGNTPLLSEDIQRDAAGRIHTRTVFLGGETHVSVLDYDVTDRLTDVTLDGVKAAHYTYDSNGNRLSRDAAGVTETGTYDARDRVTAYGGNTYTFDDHGDLTQTSGPSGTTVYDYDVLGNLRGVTLPSGTSVQYVVDASSRRMAKKVNGTVVSGYLYRDELHVAAVLDATGNLAQRFYYAGESPTPEMMTTAFGVTYRLITDQLGSVRLVVDTSSGSVIQRIDYDEFGRVTQDTNPGFQPFGFAGGLYDSDTGLVRFGARDYDPQLGRWTTRDPVGFGGGDTNLYVYVGNDPVNRTDPTGLWIETAWDVANVLIDTKLLGDDLEERKYGAAAIDTLGLTYDLIATAVPVLPGGAGVLIKGQRLAAKAAGGIAKGCARLRNWPKGWHQHHLFPKAPEFAADFKRLGINVHEHTIAIPAERHLGAEGVHRGAGSGGQWNAAWREFFSGTNVTTEQAFALRDQLIRQHGLEPYLPSYGPYRR